MSKNRFSDLISFFSAASLGAAAIAGVSYYMKNKKAKESFEEPAVFNEKPDSGETYENFENAYNDMADTSVQRVLEAITLQNAAIDGIYDKMDVFTEATDKIADIDIRTTNNTNDINDNSGKIDHISGDIKNIKKEISDLKNEVYSMKKGDSLSLASGGESMSIPHSKTAPVQPGINSLPQTASKTAEPEQNSTVQPLEQSDVNSAQKAFALLKKTPPRTTDTAKTDLGAITSPTDANIQKRKFNLKSELDQFTE